MWWSSCKLLLVELQSLSAWTVDSQRLFTTVISVITAVSPQMLGSDQVSPPPAQTAMHTHVPSAHAHSRGWSSLFSSSPCAEAMYPSTVHSWRGTLT